MANYLQQVGDQVVVKLVSGRTLVTKITEVVFIHEVKYAVISKQNDIPILVAAADLGRVTENSWEATNDSLISLQRPD